MNFLNNHIMALFTKIDLIKYIERIKLQQDILPLSLVFSDDEKTKVNELYNELIVIANNALERENKQQNHINTIEVNEAINL
jgi:hypothetical protein